MWTDAKGKQHKAKTNSAGTRIVRESKTYYVRYCDSTGKRVTESTGCKTKAAAEAFEQERLREVERIRSGVLTREEALTCAHMDVSIDEHIDAYLTSLTLKASPQHVCNVGDKLNRMVSQCGIGSLRGLKLDTLVKWLARQKSDQMGARTRNMYRSAICAFANWCVDSGRLLTHPLQKLPRADVRKDVRHERRALTNEETHRLLKATRLRPIADYGRRVERSTPPKNEARRSNWKRIPLTYESLDECHEKGLVSLKKSPETIERLTRLGVERALIYRTLLHTGLRKGELKSITLAQVELESDRPRMILDAKDEKNGNGATIYLRHDLASALGQFISGMPTEERTPSTKLFNIPQELSKIFNRDIEAANIPKRDARNRVVDVHALRHTFGTQLCLAGVPLRTAQAAMRHSTPVLTANVYTDSSMLDVASAINELPAIEEPES